jgi:hypothetical protein
VVSFPWCEEGLAPETNLLTDKLCELNSRGVLTINSQPNVNGAASSDPIIGWGAPDGYVYQKAYLEFFIPFEYLQYLLRSLKNYPRISFHITNRTVSENAKLYFFLNLILVMVFYSILAGRDELDESAPLAERSDMGCLSRQRDSPADGGGPDELLVVEGLLF